MTEQNLPPTIDIPANDDAAKSDSGTAENVSGEASLSRPRNFSFDDVEQTHRRNNVASLIKVMVFFVGIVAGLLSLYWAIASNALSVIKPTDIQPNLISDISDNVSANSRTKTSLSAIKNYRETLIDTIDVLRKGMSEIKEKKGEPKELLTRLLLNDGERFKFKWSSPSGTTGGFRLLSPQVTFFRGNNGVAQDKTEDKLNISVLVGTIQLNKLSPDNYISVTNIVAWQKSFSPISHTDQRALSINSGTIPPGQGRGLDVTAFGLVMDHLNSATLTKILEAIVDILEGKIQSTGSLISQLEREEKESVQLLESKLTSSLSGSAVYVFDISKRTMILVLIATIIITFLKLLTSEIKFMNSNIGKHFSYVYIESSRHSIDNQVKIFDHINTVDASAAQKISSSTSSLLKEMVSAIKELGGRRE